MASSIGFTDEIAAEFVNAVQNCDIVTGFTHDFYRYPARFSPLVARAAIKAFTLPGDIVMDPFMGGGTTLVEALTLGRQAIGVDISSLATFIAKVKTTPLSETDIEIIQHWVNGLRKTINLHNPPIRATEWILQGYQRNLSGKLWPIRKTLELALAYVHQLPEQHQQDFVRCLLLKTAQWALDCRRDIPKIKDFRSKFQSYLSAMIEGNREYTAAVKSVEHFYNPEYSFHALPLNRSVIGIEDDYKKISGSSPQLILTSPPYPGVHVLYHRWQIKGRKETPAPFWIANSLDGQGACFYTFGDRKQKTLKTYYEKLLASFSSLSKIIHDETIIVQIVAFSKPSWQLSKYLQVLEKAGFYEAYFPIVSNSPDGRLWRSIPNRKWYATKRGAIASSKEVVLFHRLAKP